VKGGERVQAKKLLKKMIDENISKKELADKLGLSDRQVRRITRGTSNGSLTFWRKAAEALNCELTDIIE
jgi:transcriptional regulator with XRE-family HTH domain